MLDARCTTASRTKSRPSYLSQQRCEISITISRRGRSKKTNERGLPPNELTAASFAFEGVRLINRQAQPPVRRARRAPNQVSCCAARSRYAPPPENKIALLCFLRKKHNISSGRNTKLTNWGYDKSISGSFPAEKKQNKQTKHNICCIATMHT